MAAPCRKDDYQIGIICALALEAAAVVAMLDETHTKLPKDKDDPNDYTFGRVGLHDIVIACLPAGAMGNGPAAIVANNMKRSFPIKIGLMVGIGGGVPNKRIDIRLGDVVISEPTGAHGGVVQWDYGKTEQEGDFRRTGLLNKPPEVLLQALQALKIRDITDGIYLEEALAIMAKNKPRMVEELDYRYQGLDEDRLFQSIYDHPTGDACEDCDIKQVVERKARKNTVPKLFYGNIASGNQVMKHGITRDRMAKKEGVICFEMKAAGLMDNFPCLVIRGICDYADSHKNKAWQQYAAATAAAFARVFLGFVDKQNVFETPKLSRPLTVLPFGKNKKFVGRQSYLDRLTKIFHTEDKSQNCQRAALDGLGGVGKTQIALQFAFMIQEKSPTHSIFWVQVSDKTSFENSYREIGKVLGVLGIDDEKVDVKTLVKQELSNELRGKWLFIIDNADDTQLFQVNDTLSLAEYLPNSPLGGILFTTRNHKVATDYAEAEVISIGMMDEIESRELLQISLQRKDALINEESMSKLLELLVNLPLAIKQAAAYMNEKGVSIERYVQMYENSNNDFIKCLSQDFGDQWRYKGMKNPVATTWLISFKQVEQEDPLAANYMVFMSCISEQNIPLSILPTASEPDQVDAIGTLKGFGFLVEQPSRDVYNMHRLVHIAMRNWLRLEHKLQLATIEVLKRIADIFPWPEHENRDIWTVYLPHAQSIFALTKGLAEVKESQYKLFSKIGQCLMTTGRYNEAKPLFQETLALTEKVLGKEHPDTLNSMNNLASLLDSQGRYDEAEPLYQETLALTEKVLGKEHPNTLTSMNNLAGLLCSQGRYDEAEPLYQETLALTEKVLGKEHPDTLTSMNNLAGLLCSQGRYDEAEPLYQETLALTEKVLGKEHPDTLTSMNNLAYLLESQGRYDESKQVYLP